MSDTRENDIDKLNGFLRGERSAVETYRQCIDKMDDPVVVRELRRLEQSHEDRVIKLSHHILAMGGKPDDSSGAWGTFAKLVEGGAKVFGKSAAISALEEGEDHGKKQYADLDDLSSNARAFVAREIVPEQRRTHDILSALQERV